MLEKKIKCSQVPSKGEGIYHQSLLPLGCFSFSPHRTLTRPMGMYCSFNSSVWNNVPNPASSSSHPAFLCPKETCTKRHNRSDHVEDGCSRLSIYILHGTPSRKRAIIPFGLLSYQISIKCRLCSSFYSLLPPIFKEEAGLRIDVVIVIAIDQSSIATAASASIGIFAIYAVTVAPSDVADSA